MKATLWIVFLLILFPLPGCGHKDAERPWFDESATFLGETENHRIFVTLHTDPSPASDKITFRLELEAAMVSGGGATFEAIGTGTEWNHQQLGFTWTDTFGNQGSGILIPVRDNPGSYRLTLSAENLVEPRIAGYLHKYLIRQRKAHSHDRPASDPSP